MAFELTEDHFRLKDVLTVIDLPASTYHYYMAQKANDPKDHPLEQLIQKIFNDSNETYGYRRITLALRNLGYCVNHKRVQRLMQKLGIKCMKFFHKSRRYNSYKGKVGKIASNRVNRRFTTSVPLQKLVTDVTEFKCLKDEKLYLSPIMDLYNSEIIAFKIAKRPTLDIALEPLTEAISRI
ncbi:IS3 family transposase [Dolosigranulum pigrum]|uniref:IS3 family transposase n=1 Tax=Dolosigranulum pigrum TaxID=29394 RepID=UPI001FCC6D34|nr:IS3 family transposase [Dolosigranulum pigrum]